ncbi:MAG: hypothetical protein Q9178_005715 [Gyalolechia marmorata]
MRFSLQSIGLVGLFALLAVGLPECSNTLAFYNPNLRTTCYKATWFLAPVPIEAVQSLVPYPLITPPFSDKFLFPTGFPPGTHPVLVASGIQRDIRMANLQIDTLLGGYVLVPWVDRLRDGKTPFHYAIRNYIGGENDNDLEAGVPTAVGTVTGTTILIASFSPNDDAYALVASNPPQFSAQVKNVIVRNLLSGPSVIPEAYDFNFFTATTPLYTERTIRTTLNQPQILNNQLLCQLNAYFFNETFAEPELREGNVTLYGPPAGALPSVLAGRYVRQGGLSAKAQMLGYNPEGCESAAARVDPRSLE